MMNLINKKIYQKSSLVKNLMKCLNLRGLKVTRVVLALTLLKLPLQEPSFIKKPQNLDDQEK